MPIIIYERGLIFKVNFYPPDDPKNAIQKYIVCLQEGEVPQNSHFFTGVVITSVKSGRSRLKYDVSIDPEDCDPPLERSSKIICTQIHTIFEGDIIEHSSRLSEEKMAKVDEKVLFYGIQQRPQPNST